MTLSSISDAWEDYVFENASITAISSKALAYEHTETTEKGLSAIRENQKINFWEYVVTEARQFIEVGTATPAATYTVEVRYTIEKDIAGDAHADCRDAIETLLDTVKTNLGASWQGTVDYYQFQPDAYAIESGEIAGVPVWRAMNRFTAYKS
jgi:hypothetical protein